MTQTTELGLGRTAASRLVGHPLGKSRTGSFNALPGVASGSDMAVGRIAVYSGAYNQQVAAGVDSPERTVMLPDEAGDFITDPSTGELLSTNPTLLAAGKVGGAYRVAGVVLAGDRCDDSRCDRPQSWPVGNSDSLNEWNYGQNRRPVSLGIRGYFRVSIGEDVNVGDSLAIADVTDNADPSVGLIALGSVVLAGNGAQDLPATWTVITGGKAGTSAEIYIAG